MAEVCRLDWHVAPFRADRWLDIWESAAAKMPAYGATSWSLTRSTEDTLSFQLTSIWERRSDFERYWYSDEIAAAREAVVGLYDLPLLPVWHQLVAAE
jgi:quinol monooxygenase YgiN